LPTSSAAIVSDNVNPADAAKGVSKAITVALTSDLNIFLLIFYHIFAVSAQKESSQAGIRRACDDLHSLGTMD
jgi:hypothetical protein